MFSNYQLITIKAEASRRGLKFIKFNKNEGFLRSLGSLDKDEMIAHLNNQKTEKDLS